MPEMPGMPGMKCPMTPQGMSCVAPCCKAREFHRHGIRACAAIALLLLAVLNILLTILVILDMTKLGRFKGLWVPLVLIAGLPATGVYALFRIGDELRSEANKKA
jgi:hypothetical protein